jgi:hypothetical protein
MAEERKLRGRDDSAGVGPFSPSERVAVTGPGGASAAIAAAVTLREAESKFLGGSGGSPSQGSWKEPQHHSLAKHLKWFVSLESVRPGMAATPNGPSQRPGDVVDFVVRPRGRRPKLVAGSRRRAHIEI